MTNQKPELCYAGRHQLVFLRCGGAMATDAITAIRFGLFEVDLVRGTLARQGLKLRIQEQPFRVLELLLRKNGEIVSREELRQSLWPEGTHVNFDGSLNAALKKLRAALQDDAENPRFI